jgi:hypothetical protein
METTALAEKQQDISTINETNLPETIDYSKFSDSTSVGDVMKFVSKHTLIDNAGIFGNINDFINTPIPQQATDKVNLAKAGLALLNEFNGMFNIAENGVEAVFTKYSIARGLILIQLKKLVKKAGQSWDVWATSNIPLLSERTRIDNMRLAYRSDCHKYYVVGSERLLMLIRATEEHKVDDKIGQFMTNYGIKFNPESRDEIKKFKSEVDAALNTEKLEKVGVKAKPQNVKTLSQYIPSMDNSFIMTSKAITDSKGDIDQHFEKLILNKGKERSPFEVSHAVKDFNFSGAKLIQIIDYMFRNEDTIETLDAEIVVELQEKLTQLKELANIQ